MSAREYKAPTAHENIARNKEQQLYKKIGKKYVVATDPYAYSDLREGEYIVIVRPGSTTIRQRVWPAHDEFRMAVELAKDAMVKAMLDADKMRPVVRQNSAKWMRAWKRFEKEVGPEAMPVTFHGVSFHDIVEAGIKELDPDKASK